MFSINHESGRCDIWLIKKEWEALVTAEKVSPKDLEPKEQTDSSDLTKIHPGINVGIGSDDTLFAKADGVVKFERLGRDKKQVSIYHKQDTAQ